MLNYLELERLVAETPFINSYIQKITEHSFHSFTISFFNKDEKAFDVYFEIATSTSYFARTEKKRAKSSKSQRFCQYMKANITGYRVKDVRMLKFDRAFMLYLVNAEKNEKKMLFRFYSGSGANVIILSQDDIILELLFRRPKRNEMSGEKLVITERTESPVKDLKIREYDMSLYPSFSSFIDSFYFEKEKHENENALLSLLENKREEEKKKSQRLISSLKEKIRKNAYYSEENKKALLLSSSLYLVKKGDQSVSLTDWENGEEVTIMLDPLLSPNENLEKLFSSAKKSKAIYMKAEEDLAREEKHYQEIDRHYDEIIASKDMKRIRKESEKRSESVKEKDYPGLRFTSSSFLIMVGRTSDENDRILRNYTRGSDMWLHVRDYSGSYVIIKSQKDKEIPQSVLLDAATLAVYYSKARSERVVDLYYTQVKNLRRAKGAKKGTVLPFNEKNLALTFDKSRLDAILNSKGQN